MIKEKKCENESTDQREMMLIIFLLNHWHFTVYQSGNTLRAVTDFQSMKKVMTFFLQALSHWHNDKLIGLNVTSFLNANNQVEISTSALDRHNSL